MTRSTAPRRSAQALALAFFCGAVTGCAGTQALGGQKATTEPVKDDKCPSLSGDYKEIGEGRFSNGKTFVAHLMGNAFADSFYRAHDSAERDALFVRVFHQVPTTMRMEAILDGEVVGTRELGDSGGWYCSQYRLVRFSTRKFSIEAGTGTQIEKHTFYASPDHQLCGTQEWKMDYAFGGPGGDTGYSFTACYSSKVVVR
jgi:hypothetical protein